MTLRSRSMLLEAVMTAALLSVAFMLLLVFSDRAEAAEYSLKVSGTSEVAEAYDSGIWLYPADLILEETITVVDDKGVSRDFKFKLLDFYDKDWNMMTDYGFNIYQGGIWENGFSPEEADTIIGDVVSFRLFIYRTDKEGNALDEDGNIVYIQDAEILAATDPIKVKILKSNPTITKGGINYTIFPEYMEEGVYTYIDDEVSDPSKLKGKIKIPKTVTIEGKKYTVKTIGSPGFTDCKNMTEVVLPDTIVAIGNGSFVNTGLKRITIPDSVKNIAYGSIGTKRDDSTGKMTPVKGFVIYAKNNPVAEDYAYSMGFKYVDGKRARAFRTTMKATRAKGKKVRLTWVKNKYVTGYQIYKSSKKKGKYKKAVTIKKPGIGKWTSKKMKKGKKVYFKMRTYTKIGNKTFYGKWSRVKAVKVK